MNNRKRPKVVAIVGRPNVGKSTLFNRLIGKRRAIESSEAGTTRDRLYGEIVWGEEKLVIVDTAGMVAGGMDDLEEEAMSGVELAISEADLVVFTVDVRDGLHDLDLEIAKKLRRKGVPTVVAINKCDSNFIEEKKDPFRRLGFPDLILVSAISGKNTGDLLDAISERVGQVEPKETHLFGEKEDLSVAIIGRPNAGKSTLLNSMLGQKAMIVSDVPGTTRDSEDRVVKYKSKKIRLVDTAGLRRKSKVRRDTIESFSVIRSMRAMRRSDIIVYLIDAEAGIVSLDQSIISDVIDQGKSLIVAVNKIDLWPEEEREELMSSIIGELRERLSFVHYAPVIFVSAKEAVHINNLLNQVLKVHRERNTLIEEDVVAEIFAKAKETNPQIDYMVEMHMEKTSPPIFKVRTKKGRKIHFSHERYLKNAIRANYPFVGTPIFIDQV